MPKFYVWDDECGGPDEAAEIEATDSDDAAEKYAEEDTDGAIDGIYGGGRRIGVRSETGRVEFYFVTVEYSPTFYAAPCEAPEAP